MRALLQAESWDTVRQVMEQNPILISDEAVSAVIEEANGSGKRGQHDQRVWLLVHSYLIGKCQELGVEEGFSNWKQALTDQVGVGAQWAKQYLDGDASALNEAIEQNMWALMGARRGGALAGFWDPLIGQLRFLIQEWITKRNGGTVALALLVRLLQQNVARVDKADVSWPERTMLYVGACAQWFEHNGDQAALDRAIELAEQAVAIRPDPGWISNTGRLRLFRFESKNRAQDVLAAIAAQRLALTMIPASDPALRATALDRLGISLRSSFEKSGVIDELDEAIVTHEEAVRISPSRGHYYPAHLGNLAAALFSRYMLSRHAEDRRKAGDLLRREVELCGAGHPLRADALGNLGSLLTFDKDKDMLPAPSSEAIDSLREAIQIAGNRHVRFAWELSLAQALIAAASASPQDERRLEAQQRLESLLKDTTEAWPNRASALALLGRLQADAGKDEAGVALAEAVDVGLTTRPDAALVAARAWMSWAASKNHVDHLKKASERSLDVLDALSGRQQSVQDQLLTRQGARAAVEDAAFALAGAGQIDLAVAHLERGRATVLRQSLDFTSTPQSLADTFAAVLPHMGILYLIAARRGGLAMIPGKNGVATHPLPNFTVDRVYDAVVKLLTAQEKRIQPGGADVWRSHLESVARWMFQAVAEPLQDSLIQIGPKVALLSDGLVGLLPWSAAWKPDRTAPNGCRYLIDMPIDLTISPTAGALATALSRAQAVTSRRALIVASHDGGSVVLKHIDAEVAAVASAHPGAVELLSGVTPDSVLKAMPDAAIVHFACHGSVDLQEPLNSYLALGGGQRLRIADIIATGHSPRRLAVLSACETSVAGLSAPTEVMGFPAAFLRLGFAGVVGSLWPVRDDGTALLMGKFHELIAHQDPAAALADAQRWLRSLSLEDATKRLGYPIDAAFSRVETWGAFTFSGA